jgi:hypothetical protein
MSEAQRPPSAGTGSPLISLIERVLPRVKHPYLLLVLASLFLIDVVVPTPPPLIDEIILALLTFLVASWRRREDPEPPLEPRDITPPEERGASHSEDSASLPAGDAQSKR